MSIFRKFASKKNSKGVIRESSDSDLHTRRMVEVCPCEWPHNPFMEGAGILQEFTQYAANAGLTDFSVAECVRSCLCFFGRNLGALFEVLYVGLSIMNLKVFGVILVRTLG